MPENTFTSEVAGLEDKNFTFADHPRNDLNGIAEIVAPFESESEGEDDPTSIK